MLKKLGRSVSVISLLALIVAAFSLPAHAQTVNWRADKSAYIPGDSGTLTITIINTGGNPLEVRNITVYYPWAGYDTNGKWLTGGNISYNFSPFKELTSVSGGGNNVSYTTPSFSIPSWWGAASRPQFSCPGGPSNTRYGIYSACIIIGWNADSQRYDPTDFGLSVAVATYTPSSISQLSQWVPLATLAVLVIATAFLALAWSRLGNLPKKS